MTHSQYHVRQTLSNLYVIKWVFKIRNFTRHFKVGEFKWLKCLQCMPRTNFCIPYKVIRHFRSDDDRKLSWARMDSQVFQLEVSAVQFDSWWFDKHHWWDSNRKSCSKEFVIENVLHCIDSEIISLSKIFRTDHKVQYTLTHLSYINYHCSLSFTSHNS